MSGHDQSQEILLSILGVLQGIEKKLDLYEDRLRSLEAPKETGVHNGPFSRGHVTDRAAMPEASVPVFGKLYKAEPKILYSEWHTNHLIESLSRNVHNEWDTFRTNIDDFLDLRLSKAIEKRLGDCLDMPDDERLPLKFFKTNIFKSTLLWGPPKRTVYQTKQPYERDLDNLCQYDENLRKHKGNDFAIVDFDSNNTSRLYRLGQRAVGPDLVVNSSSAVEAPWSRIILYQGATTGRIRGPAGQRSEQPIPYFTRNQTTNSVWAHISHHLTLRPRGTTTNPYADSPWAGFHTTFYEICETAEPLDYELWKHGPLYDHPRGWQFRKCAYTLYSPLSAQEIDLNARIGEGARFWTILILSPSGFFDNETSRPFPMQELGAGESQTLGHSFGRLTRLGAEMSLIGHGLEKISERWASFQAYFDYVLDSADSLMQPAEHDNLLFDDGTFSRSRKYFWAIDCLGEFDIAISDNLAQWELYKIAHVPQQPDILSRLDQIQYAFADRQYAILQNQRDYFRHKLLATKALRDALFNASAVIESRASTRLGQHVKLLTFVSIFFLPLAFTTSLWSVNDKFSLTTLIYVIIIVALSTYFVMFNINSLARGFEVIYGLKKKRIVRAMKHDASQKWKVRGKRFDVFRPKAENPEPSEWYIPLYALMHPGTLLGLVTWGAETSRGPLSRLSGLFRKRKVRSQEKEASDEGWVM